MKKIQLNLHELRVETFAIAPAEPVRGTVCGAEATPATGCLQCQGTAAVMSCFAGCTEEC